MTLIIGETLLPRQAYRTLMARNVNACYVNACYGMNVFAAPHESVIALLENIQRPFQM